MSKEKVNDFIKEFPEFVKKNTSDYFFALPEDYYDSISNEVVNNKFNNLELYVYKESIIPIGYMMVSRKDKFDESLKHLRIKTLQV
jgi:hypothetical protein